MQENARKYFLNTNVLLTFILLLGFSLRIWGLGSAEIFHDEGLYAFRSIGYLDYLRIEEQTTPIQWFKDAPEIPWWTKLSFHDAPPLFFLVQHVFFRLFGDSLFVARLPSLIAGMVAIWLMFLIGRVLFRKKTSDVSDLDVGRLSFADIAGLLAALFLAVNHVHIWISRTSIIESLLITLILANVYFFLKLSKMHFLQGLAQAGSRAGTDFSVEKYGVPSKKSYRDNLIIHWFFFGLTLGLIFLTKYIGIFLIPVYAIFLLMYRREMFREWRLYAAGVIAFLVFSPVLIYNFYLYQTIGHFDLQFAYFFGQSVPEWQASLGKIQEPFSSFVPNILAMYSKQFLILAVLGLVIRPTLFLWSAMLFITLVLVGVGSAYRFVALYVPFAVFSVILCIQFLKKAISHDWVWRGLVILFVVGELWFAIQGIFIEFPQLGTIELDRYLDKTIGTTFSFPQPVSNDNRYLDAVIKTYAAKFSQSYAKKMIIYDQNIIISPHLWIFVRRQYYHGIPTILVHEFKNIIRLQGIESLRGYEVYFVKANEKTGIVSSFTFSPDAGDFENFLKTEFHLEPTTIVYGLQLTPGGFQRMPFFSVYKVIL